MIFNEVYTKGNKTITFENNLQSNGVIAGTMLNLDMDYESRKYYHDKFVKMRAKNADPFAVRSYLFDKGWSVHIETDQPDIAERWTKMGVVVAFMSNNRDDAQKLLDNIDEDSYTIVRGADKLKKYN